ncbi:MAG: iron chaperone [Anaerolineae bacterium]
MEVFAEYLAHIDDPQHRVRTEEVLDWVSKTFPNLAPRIAWNQPMFTNHGTYVIGFSIAKHHLAVSPERAGIDRFADDIVQSGYAHSKMLFRIPWESPVDYALLQKMIEFNMMDKADYSTFWRKENE